MRYFEITILTDQDSSGCCGLLILTAEDQPATSDNVAPFNPIFRVHRPRKVIFYLTWFLDRPLSNLAMPLPLFSRLFVC